MKLKAEMIQLLTFFLARVIVKINNWFFKNKWNLDTKWIYSLSRFSLNLSDMLIKRSPSLKFSFALNSFNLLLVLTISVCPAGPWNHSCFNASPAVNRLLGSFSIKLFTKSIEEGSKCSQSSVFHWILQIRLSNQGRISFVRHRIKNQKINCMKITKNPQNFKKSFRVVVPYF